MSKASNNTLSTALSTTADRSNASIPMIFDKITDPIQAIDKLGDWFFKSGMFGLTAPAQGAVIAMACLCERSNPVEIARRYHIIEGRLSMKSEAMLAGFNERGGKHRVVSRSPEAAEIELIAPGEQPVRFAFTWEEAKQEPFPYRNGKDGEFKKNWASPRSRMQMLWARVVSDGVRAVMPTVVVGTYTPEEVMDFEPETAARVITSASSTQPAASASAHVATHEAIDVEIVNERPLTPTEEATADTSFDVAELSGPEPEPCTMEQLQEIAALGEQCGISRDELKVKLCEAAGVKNPVEMSAEQAATMVARLQDTLEKKRST